jgi:transposase
LPRRALWLQEGNATWVEPVARAQARQISASEVWRQAIAGMPQGVRDASAGGMDGTREWGRLYWGGAVFWLLAEIAVYQQSAGRALLRDALRAINRESGGNAAQWSPEKMMAVGDAATGHSALQSLYEEFALHAAKVDLANIFHRLGVSRASGESIRFDAGAELASLTRRITAP